MKKVLLSILCLGSLGAAQFEHKITVAPTEKTSDSGRKVYLAKVKVTKVSEKEAPVIIASPKIVCVEGTKAEVKIKSPDNIDVLIVSVLVPENNKAEAKASIYMTEDKKVVLSVDEKIKIDSQKKFRTWADLRERRAQDTIHK